MAGSTRPEPFGGVRSRTTGFTGVDGRRSVSWLDGVVGWATVGLALAAALLVEDVGCTGTLPERDGSPGMAPTIGAGHLTLGGPFGSVRPNLTVAVSAVQPDCLPGCFPDCSGGFLLLVLPAGCPVVAGRGSSSDGARRNRLVLNGRIGERSAVVWSMIGGPFLGRLAQGLDQFGTGGRDGWPGSGRAAGGSR